MIRLATIAALLVIATPLGARAAARVPLLDHDAAGMSVLYDRSSSAIADYSAAMLRYRTSGRGDDFPGRGYPFIWRGSPVGGNWTWVAPDGSIVRRVERGSFLLILVDRPGNLFVEITCLDAGWPMFACSDDQRREMAAPDLSTIVFDGIVYSRSFATEASRSPTPVEASPELPVPPETSPTDSEE